MEQPPPNPSRLTFALISLGVSSFFFLQVLVAGVAPHHHLLYHLDAAISVVLVPVTVDVLILAALLTLLLCFSCARLGMRRIVLSALMTIAPCAGYFSLSGSVRHLPLPSPHRDATLYCLAVCLFLLLAFVRSPWGNRLFEFAWQIARAAFSIGGFVTAVTLLQILWFGWQARGLNDSAPFAKADIADLNQPHRRVIWIVFDELGYDQLNGNRLPGLALPNFDRFSAQASDFQHVIPAGLGTETVLPGLLTGSRVDGVWLSSSGRRFQLIAPGNDRIFDPHDTVFADANHLGYRNAVVGWYIPYCRMLASELSSCAWSSRFASQTLYPSNSVPSNILHPFARVAESAWHLLAHPHDLSPDQLLGGRQHIQDFQTLREQADRALADPSLTFLLIHLPIPHPDGIWNRQSNTFAIDHSNYVDNLALADRYLGHVRSVLETSGQWDDATILLLGDHGWRTTTEWANDPTWSDDDQQASHGRRFDPRPAYLLKLPNQHQPAQITTSFDALRTRALLDQLLTHGITTPSQLQAWLASQSTP